MNNTIKFLVASLPMMFLAGCYEPSLGTKDIEIRAGMGNTPGWADKFPYLLITCKSDKPIMIKSITVNGTGKLYPVNNNKMSLNSNMFGGTLPPVYYMSRWLPERAPAFSTKEKVPVVFSCSKGQKELLVAGLAFYEEGDNGLQALNRAMNIEIIDVDIETTSHGNGGFVFREE